MLLRLRHPLVFTLIYSLFTMFTTGEACATHLVGGELTYEYLGSNAAGQNLFEVHCFIYRDCSSANTNGTGFDASAAIGVYQGSVLVDNVSGSLDPALVTNIIPQNPNNCAFLPEDLCIERAEYIINLALEPSQQPYTLVHQRCCRSPSIINLENPQDQGFSLTTTIPGNLTLSNPNSSPSFNELPQAFICNNYPFSLDNSATDSDGDSLSYSLCPIFLGGTFLAPIPNPPTGPPFAQTVWSAGFDATLQLGATGNLAIHPVSGQLTGTPNLVGKFAVGVCVEEWRNGQQIGSILRDFTIDIVNCNITSPLYELPPPCSGMTIEFEQLSNPSESYSWDFGVANATDDVSSEAEPSFTYDEPGVYDVSLFFETGSCSDSLIYEIVVHEPWSVDFDFVNLTCGDGGWYGELLLDTSAWTSYIDWTWEFGSTSLPTSLSNEHPDEVWFVQGESSEVSLESSAFACVNNFNLLLEFPELPEANFEVISEPCSGLEVQFDNLSPESGPFAWNFGVGAGWSSNEISPVFTFPGYGTFQVTLNAGAGSECAEEQTETVEVWPENPLDSNHVIQPVSFCDSTGYVLLYYNSESADEVLWSFPGVLESSESILEAYFPEEGTYAGTLTAYNAYCDVTVSWEVEAVVPPPLEEVSFKVPNVISPNNDGRNDELVIEMMGDNDQILGAIDPGQFSMYSFSVYNRWGNAVFSSQQASKSWRPDSGVSEGTYYVVVQAKHLCNSEIFNYAGEVTLVR